MNIKKRIKYSYQLSFNHVAWGYRERVVNFPAIHITNLIDYLIISSLSRKIFCNSLFYFITKPRQNAKKTFQRKGVKVHSTLNFIRKIASLSSM